MGNGGKKKDSKKSGGKKPVSLVVFIVAIAYFLLTGNIPQMNSISQDTGVKQTSTQSSGTNKNGNAVDEDYSFRSEKLWMEHFEKHGEDMGFDSAEEYLEAANDVIDDEDVLHKTEKEDGDDIYYLEDTNEFVVVSTDGYIRTYFEPSGGMEYYERQ